MSAVELRLRADLRRRWRGWLALSVLIGLMGAAVLTAAAGARRTETAYPRFRKATAAADVLVSHDPVDADAFYSEVASLPGVVAFGRAAVVDLSVIGRGNPRPDDLAINAFAALDRSYAASMNRPKVLRGRRFDLDRPEQVMVDQGLARRLHLRPGSSFDLLATPFDADGNAQPQNAARFTFRVTAIVVFANEVVPINRTDSYPQLVLTPAFARSYGAPFLASDAGFVRLDPETSPARLRQELEDVRSRHPGMGGELFVADVADQAAKVQRAIRPQAFALAAFALLLGLIALVVIAQILSRQVLVDSAEYPILRAVGMERRQLAVLAMLRCAAVTVVGAAIATGVAVAASRTMPIGPARLAEPHPGLAVDGAVLGIGFVGVVILPLLAAAPSIFHAARERASGVDSASATTRPSRIVAVATAGWPVSCGVGVRMALEPARARRTVSVRSALVGTTVAFAALLTALVFGTNLGRLIDTPRLYGQSWDVLVDGGFSVISEHRAVAELSSDPDVVAYAGGTYGEVALGGRAVPAVGIDLLEGDVFPTILEGRPPSSPDEVVLGSRTLRRIHRRVGQTAVVKLGDSSRTMRIVGRAVFPSFGRGVFTPTGLGEGAAVEASLLPVDPNQGPGPAPGYNFYLLRLRRDADRATVAQRSASLLADAFGCIGPCKPITQQRPTDIGNYARVRQSPLVLGACLGVLAMGTFAHVLLTLMQQRRRDLATLKALGFVRRQVSSSIAWQAIVLACIAVLVGLPLGVAAGRWAWLLFARSVGVGLSIRVPLPAIVAAVASALIAATLVATAPALWAARLRPAQVLRTE